MTSTTSPPLITQCPGAWIWWLEDDRTLCRHVAPRLQDCGWRLAVFHRLPQLRTALQQDEPDLILLELRVTGDQALSAIRDWRRQGLACPVLILSALADAGHRIDGLAAGANDYLAKPFHLAELTWRIEHLLLSSQPRRLRQHAMNRPIPLGPLMLEPSQSCLRNPQGDEVRLTRGDLALLLALLSQPNVVHPRSALLRASGSLVDTATSRTLDVRLSRLRRLLNEASAGVVGIACVRGRGYRLSVSPTAGAADPKPLQALTVAALPIGLSQSLPMPVHASPIGLFLLALPLGLASVLCWMRAVGNSITHRWQPDKRKNVATNDLHACCHALITAYPPGSVEVDVPHRPLTVDADLLSPALHHLLKKALAHGHAPVRLRAEPQPSPVVLVIGGISLRPPTDPHGTTSVRPDHDPGTDGVLEFCRQAQATLEFRGPAAGGLQIRLSWGASTVQ